MMANYYIQVEEEAWKCPKHPSITKRRRRHYNGVCPSCLHDRLLSLCPDRNTTSSSSSNTSSSDYSSSSSSSTEPPSLLRRSRSLVAKTPSFLSALRRPTSKAPLERNQTEANDAAVDRETVEEPRDERIEEFARMITRSRSVSSGMATSRSGFADVAAGRSSSSRFRAKSSSLFRSFTSPMRLFRSSKRTAKVLV